MSDSEQIEVKKYRLVMVGNSNVGKTCIARRAVYGTFDENQPNTVGQDNFTFHNETLEPHVDLNITDTAGQEIYRTVNQTFFENADAFIIVYSIDDRTSFDDVDGWYDTIKNSKYIDQNSIIYIVENKKDLRDSGSINYVQLKEGEEKANGFGAKFLSVSAKTENTNDLFNKISFDCLNYCIPKRTGQMPELNDKDKGKEKCC